MERNRGRLFAMVLAVACAGTAVGAAIASAGGPPDPLTRAEVYRPGMSLPEVAQAATGRPGEFAPPCPDAATAAQLKEQGLPFGPCDPLPEKGAPVRVAAPGDEPPPADDVVCPVVILGKGVDLTVTLPCGHGADVLASDVTVVDGEYCADVTYRTDRNAQSRRDTLCEGDVPSGGGEPVRGPSNADEHRN